MALRKSNHLWFFAAAALFAAFTVPFTALSYLGLLPHPLPDLAFWHGHEMLFGFALALMGGYFSGTYSRRVTLLLLAFWLLARGVLFGQAFLPPTYVWLALGYPLLLFWHAGRPVLRAAKSPRNAVLGYVLAGLPLAEAAGLMLRSREDLAAPADLLFATLLLVVLVIFVMGGRLTAAATSGAHQKRGAPLFRPAQPRLEWAGVVAVVGLIAATLLPVPKALFSLLALAAAGVVLLRLFRWRVWLIREAAVSGLHLGFLWLVLSFLLIAGAPWAALYSATDALHAITIGALGTLSLTIMARLTLQRARLPVVLPGDVKLAVLLVNLAAVARIVAFAVPTTSGFLVIAALCWGLGYLGFVAFIRRSLCQKGR